MRTSEFKTVAKRLGYKVQDAFNMLIIYKGSATYGGTKKNKMYDVQTTEYTNEEVLNLLVEYANTALADREEPKRYFIRPKNLSGYITLTDEKSDMFTKDQMKDLGFDINKLHLEEVKDDNTRTSE